MSFLRCASYIEAETAYTVPTTAHIEAVTAHIDPASAHIDAPTAHMEPGTIEPPFEPIATAPEKMANPFLFERGFTPSDPHRLLKQPLRKPA